MNECPHIMGLHAALDLLHLMVDVNRVMAPLIDFRVLVVIVTVGVEGVELGVLVALQDMGHLLLDGVVAAGQSVGQGLPVHLFGTMHRVVQHVSQGGYLGLHVLLLGTGHTLQQVGYLALERGHLLVALLLSLPEAEVSPLLGLVDLGLNLVLVHLLLVHVVLFGHLLDELTLVTR